jgi:FkbM family methyltransferase
VLTKQDIKYLLRSGSFSFMKNNKATAGTTEIANYIWNNKPIYYRPGTFDTSIIYNIILRKGKKGEYWIKERLNPRVIFDIGGNIGITAIYFAHKYTDAQIYTFEPVPENYDLLVKNVAPYSNVKAYNFGLGSKDAIVKIYQPSEKENKGGFSCFPNREDNNGFNIEIRDIQKFINQEGINQIDLIKIDTEGSEYDILLSIDKEILKNVNWIIGELHGVKDYELLRYLSQYFNIGIQKKINQNEFIFNACKKTI